MPAFEQSSHLGNGFDTFGQSQGGHDHDWHDHDPRMDDAAITGGGGLPIFADNDSHGIHGALDMQALRSGGEWSIGKHRTEASIY